MDRQIHSHDIFMCDFHFTCNIFHDILFNAPRMNAEPNERGVSFVGRPPTSVFIIFECVRHGERTAENTFIDAAYERPKRLHLEVNFYLPYTLYLVLRVYDTLAYESQNLSILMAVCCLHIKPFFLPNDISSTPSVRPDSSS